MVFLSLIKLHIYKSLIYNFRVSIQGTLIVLNACAKEDSTVKRVVLTRFDHSQSNKFYEFLLKVRFFSSIVAISGDYYDDGRLYNETDWTNANKEHVYAKSKVLAERAAWDFVEKKKTNKQKCFELAVINPAFVIGPLVHESEATSMQIVVKLLRKEIPMVPDIYFCITDVRDVALAHIKAMQIPEAANNRHIIASKPESISMQSIALTLEAEFKSKGYSIPTRIAPNFLIRILGFFDKSNKMAIPWLGKNPRFDNTRMLNVLKIEPHDVKSTIIETGYSLIEKGIVKHQMTNSGLFLCDFLQTF